ncbi:MAG TPA: MlaD family protein [Chryseolinea sp.]|jgi:phospholipid/cholesterol/gamma-HCH transport system substrate-binding protein|nr:MlaD family protein [Chryseolinea sp.]
MKLSKEFKVGLFMVVTITLLYFGFNFLKGIDFFSSSKKYYAVYENVDKLTESNQIFLNGYAVGRVSKIQIQQQLNRVLVELDINSDIVLTDSSVALLNGELLGGRFIQLLVGPGGQVLQPKDTLKSDVANGIMDFFQESAQPVAANLQITLQNLNTILEGLARNTKRIDTMFLRLQNTPAILNRTLSTANSNIDGLSESFRSVAGNLNGTLEELKPTLSNFRSLSDSLKVMQLNSTVNKAQQSLGRLNETLARLNSGDNTVSKLMTEDSLYVNLNQLLNSIDSLAKHFNKNPKHFMAPLGKSQRRIEKDLKKQKDQPKKD